MNNLFALFTFGLKKKAKYMPKCLSSADRGFV